MPEGEILKTAAGRARAKALACWAICLAASCPSARGSPPADAMAASLATAIDWMNGAANRGPSRLSRPLFAQLLPMDVESYKGFVRNAYAEPPKDLGTPALSAFLQLNGKMDAKLADACFLLYNAQSQDDLKSQFVSPHDAAFPPSLAPYLFMAAHEYGHCLDFRARGARLRPALLGEAYADIFAILILRKADVPAKEIESIVASRHNGGATHLTLAWCKEALSLPIANLSFSIEDLAKVADNLMEAKS